jgi:hypothetical protein
MDWWCGSSSKTRAFQAPALQTQSPELKLQAHQKKKKKQIM